MGNNLWKAWTSWIEGEKEQEPSEEEKFLEELRLAHRDWMLAQQRLDLLTDPDLIDHAIYVLEAAEKKYGYYLRKAREDGIRIEFPYPKAM
ncbi:DUF2508 family protein [Effusibacillus lacus]|uniref:DUF2508 domain-containing protein n=1 Tax=Effusibacillus lacus TaxID=1348429 RepID=A0A292YJZ5_9BACL|nr:DUF2508 family protein [Effusibacillus lacus]TCS74424.1 uncharacterized protein DUF2508 [Effusibacillus lacus]GAX88704.1 hypothetical protein EFBL_0316 [Effusibacillus lacus]